MPRYALIGWTHTQQPIQPKYNTFVVPRLVSCKAVFKFSISIRITISSWKMMIIVSFIDKSSTRVPQKKTQQERGTKTSRLARGGASNSTHRLRGAPWEWASAAVDGEPIEVMLPLHPALPALCPHLLLLRQHSCFLSIFVIL